MAEKSTIARPYAKAVFELALEHQQLADWSEVLDAAAAVAADPQVEKLLTSPRVTPVQLGDLVLEVTAAALGRPQLQPQVHNFIHILAANRRLGFLPEIAARYAKLRADSQNTVDVTVTSAAPLSEAQQQQYAAVLKARLKREVRLHCVVDASLLGGAILKADDLVIDGSLRGRLERMRAQVAA